VPFIKLAGILKLVRNNISGMSKHVLIGQTLQKHAWSFDHRINFAMALFILEELWRISALLLPSTLTIILSHSQTCIVFFLDNIHLIYTYLLGFVFLASFYLTFIFLHIFYHFDFHLYPLKAVDQQPKGHVPFLDFLA